MSPGVYSAVTVFLKKKKMFLFASPRRQRDIWKCNTATKVLLCYMQRTQNQLHLVSQKPEDRHDIWVHERRKAFRGFVNNIMEY